MITTGYVVTMAAYNRWQNRNLYGAAGTLEDRERRADRGAFFGSIHGTLNHVLWGDQIWMHRFAGDPEPRVRPLPDSVTMYEDWQALCDARAAQDERIIAWAESLSAAWLAADQTWLSGSQKREVSRPRGLLVTHMFNHQTHHRGQVHAMLTAAGARPDDTDLAFMPI